MSSTEPLTLYKVDGDGGCDYCQANTGFYFDVPDRPHPYCECPIEEWVETDEGEGEGEGGESGSSGGEITLAAHTDKADGGTGPGPDGGTGPGPDGGTGPGPDGGVRPGGACQIVVKNVVVGGYSTVISRTQRGENKDIKNPKEISFSLNVDEDWSLPADLLEAAEADGWSPSSVARSQVSVEAPAGCFADNIQIEELREITTFEGERWMVCKEGPDQLLDRVTGQHEKSIDITCNEPSWYIIFGIWGDKPPKRRTPPGRTSDDDKWLKDSPLHKLFRKTP